MSEKIKTDLTGEEKVLALAEFGTDIIEKLAIHGKEPDAQFMFSMIRPVAPGEQTYIALSAGHNVGWLGMITVVRAYIALVLRDYTGLDADDRATLEQMAAIFDKHFREVLH